jgi:hypothetical protein
LIFSCSPGWITSTPSASLLESAASRNHYILFHSPSDIVRHVQIFFRQSFSGADRFNTSRYKTLGSSLYILDLSIIPAVPPARIKPDSHHLRAVPCVIRTRSRALPMTKCMCGPGNDSFADVFSIQFVHRRSESRACASLFKEHGWPVLRAFVRGRLRFHHPLTKLVPATTPPNALLLENEQGKFQIFAINIPPGNSY